MSIKSIEARLQAAEARVKPSDAPIMRCWFSDGTVRDLHILDAINESRGIDKEPHVIRAECIAAEEKAPQLVEILMQMIKKDNERNERQRYNPAL